MNNFEEDFKNVIKVIRDDKIGQIAKTDPIIMMIGSRLYEKIKKRLNKKDEVEKSVRSDMRRLSYLYYFFKGRKAEINYKCDTDECNAGDMFLRENLEILIYSIKTYTAKDDASLKSGLKKALLYLIKDAAEKCVGYHLASGNDTQSGYIKDFLALLNLRKNEIFADADYDLNYRRNVKNRKPAQLPVEDDIAVVRNHVIKRMNELISDKYLFFGAHEFVELRDCSCVRLTLFNGRRGAEPARLVIREWLEAKNGEWLDKQRIEIIPEEACLADGLLITFQPGKGVNRLVPVVIPKDTVGALEKLSNVAVRSEVGISPNNMYLFPSIQNSDRHCSGWHSLQNVLSKASYY